MGQAVRVKMLHGTTGLLPWFKIGKRVQKSVYCHPAYLTYMQSISCEMLGWMKHRQESRLLGEISTISDKQVIPL